MAGVVSYIRDRLTNVMSGMGTTADRRGASFYAFVPIDPAQAEAAYRSSWLVRKIVDVPPLDMTRAWRDWQADAADIEKLEAEEKRLGIKEKAKRALILARLFGGSAIYLGTNDANPMEPLNPGRITTGGLAFCHVLSRWQLSLGQQRLDPADPWFGKPEHYSITAAGARNEVKIHPSRVVEFIGQKAPEGSYLLGNAPGSWLWGDPIMQSIGDAVKNADLAQTGFASLIDKASVDVLQLKDLMSIVGSPEGEVRISARLSAFGMGKSNWRAAVLDKEDEWKQMQISWSGIPEAMDAFLLVVAGAADIPMTRLLGQSPRGLQSTGDGEERDYQSMITARQDEQLRPALDRIDEALIPSALGSVPSDIHYVFGPLQQENEKDGADIELKVAQTLTAYSNTGELPSSALAKIAKNRMIESGRWPGAESAFEEAEAAGDDPTDPANQNEGDLQTLEQRVAAMEKNGQIAANDAAILLTDASPRSLYVSRKLLNGADVVKWAKGQGFETTLPADDMHVTICFSREPVDWMSFGSAWSEDDQGRLRVRPGGARMLDRFGNLKQAVVLLFNSSELSWRHEDFKRGGASFDFDQYQPHVTITYDAPADLDVSKIEPYQGELLFGPEIFAEVVEDWEQGIEEE